MSRLNAPRLVLIVSILLVAFSQTSLAVIINVPSDHPTIQAAVDAASEGDTVFVWPGVYEENVEIIQAVVLKGHNKHNTIIDAAEVGSCVRVRANGTVVDGFTLVNSGYSEFYDWYSDAGVRISDADSCHILNCVFRDNPIASIHIGAGSRNRIEHSQIHGMMSNGTQSLTGIRIAGEHPDSVVTYENWFNEITSNFIDSCSLRAIYFPHDINVSYTQVRGNYIRDNHIGLEMATSRENEISYNVFIDNDLLAIMITHCMCGGSQNQFHHNAFIDNGSPSCQCFDDGYSVEYWYDSGTLEGNYWSGYSGSDGDGDGVGDVPFMLCYNSSADDPYPLMAIPDFDADGWHDSVDNCPELYNPDQADVDGDFIGDMCDDCTDYDGDGYSNVGITSPDCPEPDNCDYAYNPNQEDTDGDGVGDSCDVRQLTLNTLETECTQLIVLNNGNFGYYENDRDGKANLDYFYAGDCDQSAILYLFGGSPVIGYVDGADTIIEQSVYFRDYDDQAFRTPGWGNPEVPIQSEPTYQYYYTGTMTTQDFRLGLELAWWAPQHSDSCPFIIQALKVYSFDGETHEDIAIGEVIDWDIPSDDAGNVGDYDSSLGLIYVRGVESDGQGCQANDARYGGQAFLTMTINDTCFDSGELLGAHTRPNSGNIWSNASPTAWYDNMHEAGYSASEVSTDQHTMMTFMADLTVNPGDTHTIYSVLTSVMNGDEDELRANVLAARQWFQIHVASICNCCLGSTGDIDGNGIGPDIADLVYVVNFIFNGGPEPPCLAETDVDGNGDGPDIADLVYLVNYMFNAGPAPSICP